MYDKELNDRLDDIFGGDLKTDAPKAPPASYTQKVEPTYFEPCGKCRGTGTTPWGVCFRCQGKKGKTFKSSPQSREAARTKAAGKKVDKAKENQEDFKAAHPDVAEWIDANQSFDFARSLGEAVAKWGSLTEKQLEAAKRCAAKAAERKAAKQAAIDNAPTVNALKIEEAFATAKAKANRPGQLGVWLRLHMQSGEHTLRFSLGRDHLAGKIFVKEGDKRLGVIEAGKFTPRFECTDTEQAAVLDVCNDPLKAAKAYGKAFSCCCVCNRELTNDDSIARMMGPYCAAKYGFA